MFPKEVFASGGLNPAPTISPKIPSAAINLGSISASAAGLGTTEENPCLRPTGEKSMKENEMPDIDHLRAQFHAVHHRLEVLTDDFMRLPSQMSVEEQAELDALEHEHSRLFRKIAAMADMTTSGVAN